MGRRYRTRERSRRLASTSSTAARMRTSSRGGVARGEEGYFIEPTLIETKGSRVPLAVRRDLRTVVTRARLSGQQVERNAQDRR